jgi:hypothetical protein
MQNSEAYINHLINQFQTTLAETPVGLEVQLLALSEQVATKKTEAQKRINELSLEIKNEVVEILRKVVDAVNRDVGFLPFHAREIIKRAILVLPQKLIVSHAV